MRRPSRPKRADPLAGSLRARALALLGRRDWTRAELRARLLPLAAEGEPVDPLLDDLAARGWLSDRRYAEQFVHSRRERYGPERLERELRSRGVDPDVAREAAAAARGEAEFQAASALWRRRYGRAPGDPAERARQLRFLIARGWSPRLARQVVGSAVSDDDQPEAAWGED